MALAGAILKMDYTRRRRHMRVEVTISGNYVTGGDTLDLSAFTNPNNLDNASFRRNPDSLADVIVEGEPAGYAVSMVKGSALNNWLVKFQQGNGVAAFAEIAQAGYPAGLSAQKLYLMFITLIF